MYNLNSGDIQLANSKAISLCAKVQPYFQDFEIIQIAFVDSIHFLGVITKALLQASLLNWSNSTSLKSILFIFSQVQINSNVNLFLNQFLIISAGNSEFFLFAISVKEIKSFSFC
jgi:hypothetical protein